MVIFIIQLCRPKIIFYTLRTDVFSNKLIISAIACILSGNAISGTMSSITQTSDWSKVITLSAGNSWAKAGSTQILYVQPDVEQTYSATKQSNSLFATELFAGLQHSSGGKFVVQTGLALAFNGDAKLQGDIWEDSDPEFNNYFYSYRVKHKHLAVKGKLIADMGMIIQPYLSGSAGIAKNRDYSYLIVPKIEEEIAAPNFSKHTSTSFTYTLGAGVQKSFNDHWQAGLGYEFADWGKNRLGRAYDQTVNDGLTLAHLYTNQLQFSISYIM